MEVQEIAEFIVGNDLTYQQLVALADQDGFATLMNPNVKKAQIILSEMGKIEGNPIDIFNQYKISLDEYRRPRTFSSRENIEFGDFSAIPDDRTRTVEGTISTPSTFPLAEPLTSKGKARKNRLQQDLGVEDINDLYERYNLEGEQRTLDDLQEKIDVNSKLITPRNMVSPRGLYGDVVKKTKHQRILDLAVEQAETTKKEETGASALATALPRPTDLLGVGVAPGTNSNVSVEDMKQTVYQPSPGGKTVGSLKPTIRQEVIEDGDYQYTLTNGEPSKIIRTLDGKEFPMNNEAREIILEMYNEQKSPAESIDVSTSNQSQPTIEKIEQGDYTNVYRDGKLIQIEQNGRVVVPEDKINEKMRDNAQDTYDRKSKTSIPVKQEVKEEVKDIENPSIYLQDLSETIAMEEPGKLKQLGQKIKEGYQGLGNEQKAMMGLMGLEVLSEGVNYLGPARKEGRDRRKILEERREQGQLGVDEKQDSETMKYMTRPVRALAEETEREQQAVMAGMGETRSAADLRRLRDSRDAQMTDALSRAGQEVARQQMARKEMEKRELNQLQAYQQENLRNLTNRITGAAANIAGTFGANAAAEADIQSALSPDMIERKVQIYIGQGMTEAEARRKAQTEAINNARMFTGMRG